MSVIQILSTHEDTCKTSYLHMKLYKRNDHGVFNIKRNLNNSQSDVTNVLKIQSQKKCLIKKYKKKVVSKSHCLGITNQCLKC